MTFFSQPPDKRLVEFRQGGGLFPKEGANAGDTLFLLVPPGTFQLKLLLIFTQAVKRKNTIRLLIGLIVGIE